MSRATLAECETLYLTTIFHFCLTPTYMATPHLGVQGVDVRYHNVILILTKLHTSLDSDLKP